MKTLQRKSSLLFISKLMLLGLSLLLVASCGCPPPTNRPTYEDPGNDGKPIFEGSFLEIANNPNSNSYQKHTVQLMMDYVMETDVDIAYEKLKALTVISLSFNDLRFVYEQSFNGKKYCGGSIETNNYIKDLTPLSEFNSLISLDLSENRIESLDALESLKNLKTLILNDNRIKNLTPLSILTNLETLELYDNDVNDFSPLIVLTNLKLLVVNEDDIKKTSILQVLVDNGLVISSDRPQNLH